MEPRRIAAGLLLVGPFLLAGCGGDDPQPVAGGEPAPAETVVADEPSGGVAAPGSGFGLGSSAGGDEGGGSGERTSGRNEPSRRSETPQGSSSTASATESRDEPLPDPPATAIELPPAATEPDSYFDDVADLDRDASDPKYAEFRELCTRNTDLLVRLARARKAMRDGGVREEEAYLAVDGQYAEFTEQMGNYMAQRRWNDRDREVMGLLLTRSNEEALNRVRSGS